MVFSPSKRLCYVWVDTKCLKPNQKHYQTLGIGRPSIGRTSSTGYGNHFKHVGF